VPLPRYGLGLPRPIPAGRSRNAPSRLRPSRGKDAPLRSSAPPCSRVHADLLAGLPLAHSSRTDTCSHSLCMRRHSFCALLLLALSAFAGFGQTGASMPSNDETFELLNKADPKLLTMYSNAATAAVQLLLLRIQSGQTGASGLDFRLF
jgi:hypothetical protein